MISVLNQGKNMLHTASSLSAYQRCPRFYQHRYLDEWTSAQPAKPLLVGTVFHAGSEAFWNGADLSGMRDAARSAMQEHSDWWRDQDLEKAKLDAYLRGYYTHRRSYRDKYDVIDVEREWSSGPMAGKMDLVLRGKDDGRIYVVDHKTSGAKEVENPASPFWTKLTFDTQIATYTVAARYLYDLDYFPSFIYDVVRKTSSKPAMKKRISRRKSETEFQYQVRKAGNTETAREYQDRIAREYEGDESRFMWRAIPMTSDTLLTRVSELKGLMKSIDEFPIEFEQMPRNQNGCITKYGLCDFFPICSGKEGFEGSDRFVKKQAHSELTEEVKS